MLNGIGYSIIIELIKEGQAHTKTAKKGCVVALARRCTLDPLSTPLR